MSAMMGADPGYLCALRPVTGTVNFPADTGGCGYRRGAAQDDRRAGWFTVTRWGQCVARATRDRELEVIAVEAGARRGAFLPVMLARPSRVAK
jgi:hypothetical protein